VVDIISPKTLPYLDVVREIADWVLFLDQGKLIADGETSNILRDRKLAEIYFGT